MAAATKFNAKGASNTASKNPRRRRTRITAPARQRRNETALPQFGPPAGYPNMPSQ